MDYTGSGIFKIGGCSKVTVTYFYKVRYGVGSILYNLKAARKGNFEKIVIKRHKIVNTRLTQGATIFMYIDTLNGLWNEDEIGDQETAKALVEAYLSKQMEYYARATSRCEIV